MQWVVAPAATGVVPAPFNVAKVQTDLPIAFNQSQDAPVIPEAGYSSAYATSYTNTYARISDCT